MTLVCCEEDCTRTFLYSGRGPTTRRCDECKAERRRRQVRERTAQYRQRMTPEQVDRARETYRAWYTQNAEQQRAQALAWYHANRQRAASNRKIWDAGNPDYNRRWVEDNRDRHNAKGQRRRARERAAFIEDVDPLVVYYRDGGTCWLCRRQVPRVVGDVLSPSLDHVIPLSRGGEHSYANVRLSHSICNARKGAKEVMPNAIT